MTILPKPIRGIIVPLVTPLLDGEALDKESLGRLVEHVLAGGVRGIFVLGTTGEGPSLSRRLREEMIRETCQMVKGRVPILAGITDTSFEESLSLARTAADAGAQAVVVAPPYYFPSGQTELLEYLAHLAPRLPLPFFLYHIPRLTKVGWEPLTVREAASLPNLAGIKDSSEDPSYLPRLIELLRDRPDIALLTGSETLLARSILGGAHGGILGGANLFPRLFADLYEAAAAGDCLRAAALQDRVHRVASAVYGIGRHGSSPLKGLKGALSLKGLCGDFMAEPFHRFREEERRRLEKSLAMLDSFLQAG